MDFNILNIELQLPKYSAMNDAQAANAVNSVNIKTKVGISTHDMQQYLVLVDKLILIEASPAPLAVEAVRVMELFQSLDISDSTIEAKTVSIVDGLIVAGLLDESDKAYILGLGNKTISRAEELGLSAVIEANVKFARTL